MKVLVIGGGGREHALVWALKKSERVTEVVCAPGNGGIAAQARCIPMDVADLASLVAIAEQEKPDLTVVGPELPLSIGIVDELKRLGFKVFGPTQAAAKLETSKAFAKEFMQRHGIPTAAYAVCTSIEQVREELLKFEAPAVVVKADGLAAGKGVVMCSTHAEAEAAAEEMFSGALLGAVQTELVLEEFLEGEELSFFALCDGTHAIPMAAAQDHKRIGEGDTGPNTGGMGAYSTDGLMTPAMRGWLTKEVAQQTVDGMRAEGTPFVGILFCGMMMTPRGPMVLEFNTRFGDPETQAMLMRMETDVLELFEAGVDGTADTLVVRMKEGASVCVIAASGGYPGKIENGKIISGLDEAAAVADGFVFHSGTTVKDGALVTAGGRVLGITAMSENGLEDALAKAYSMMEKISFEGMQFRRDIGWRAIRPMLQVVERE
ncbi:MAG: phosphoribosylamine-glycine ligase [Acidobacteriaceae bacterium]|nr:phosphoribosylamine-glycine ligase [Acidobacteriaceae bacterium]